jgi:hypothetical protein
MSVTAIATRTGRTPDEVAYDYIIEENQYLYFPRSAKCSTTQPACLA